ncbi:MAG: hypothetical protein ABIN58_09175 [candidate division WOR-3 bacterium]
MDQDSLITIRIRDSQREDLRWAIGMQMSLPGSLVRDTLLLEDAKQPQGWKIPESPPLIPSAASSSLRLRSAFTLRKPLSSRLPFSYHHVPAPLRMGIGAVIGRWRRKQLERWDSFPRWPLDLSADFLDDLGGVSPSHFAKGPTPILLSHDVDSAEGLRNLVKHFLPLEESAGARSVNFIVPCSWPLDHHLLVEVRARGHEIGVHGYDHSNRTPFAGQREREHRLRRGIETLARYGARGYRSPSLVRTPFLLKDLACLYDYDSSIPTSGGMFPVPNNGCASARPFRVQGIAEIPLSLPRDGSLRFLNYSPGEILRLWIDCAEQISKSGGVVVLLTHCEERFSGNPPMLDTYERFLDWIGSSGRYCWSTPEAVLAQAFGSQQTPASQA